MTEFRRRGEKAILDSLDNLYTCPQHIKKSAYTTLVRPLLEYSSSVWDPHTKTLVNKIEIVQRRESRFSHNDYKTIEKGCVSEMIGKINLESLNIRRTNRRLTIFHKAINGHLEIFSQFCVALDIIIAKHTLPSTPANSATNTLSSPDHYRQNSHYRSLCHYQRTKDI